MVRARLRVATRAGRMSLVVLTLRIMSSLSEPSFIELAHIETAKRRKRYRCLKGGTVCVLAASCRQEPDGAHADERRQLVVLISLGAHGNSALSPGSPPRDGDQHGGRTPMVV